ncbi:hypothetical protein ACTQV8_09710 [Lactobacillus amylovorus]|nr:hypothetical protein [Lactobacillus amylovorus]MDB6231047.1 hypothetical protein [Lactobacillus amylovorus]
MIEGKFYLIKRQGTKYKFYWAPYDPAPKRDFEDWGVAVVDLSWKTEDPRPLHLRQKKIFLQPWIHILRDPNVYSERFNYYGKDWRGYSLNSNILRGFHWWDKDHRKMLGIGVEVIVYANNDKAADQWF